jgi:peptidoglycan/xylan/chitin deacetylase (PgdA/CDA1 family)
MRYKGGVRIHFPKAEHMTDSTLARIRDQLHLSKMDFLTALGKLILPEGTWTGSCLDTSHAHDSVTCTKTLYLTFDDGPHPDTTPYLIELLEKEHARATFFLIGRNANKYPKLVEMIAKAGHTLGNHTYSHLFMPYLTDDLARIEIESATKAIEDAAGRTPQLFRPPYGVINRRHADLVDQGAMRMIYWGAVPNDSRVIGARRVIARVKQRLEKGALLVLHEGRCIAEQSLQSTAGVLKAGKERGFCFRALKAP